MGHCYNCPVPPSPGRGPFRPGTGATPPYLAGREAEQRLFRDFLSDLASGIPPGTQVVLYGPRGNGKTVLLDWLERNAVAAGLETAVLRPAETPDVERLREMLAPRSWWERLAAGEVAAGGFSWKPGDLPAPPVAEILSRRAASSPLVLLVDEAHTLDLDVGRALLNAAQEAGRKHPFLLVLAGTPHLEGRLNAMGASFWNRACQVRVGRLREEATAEAFRRPFAAAGITVRDEAIATMTRESQRYPYFVQVLGGAVWEQTAALPAGRRVTAEIVDRARPGFDRTKGRYYRQRLDELSKRRFSRVALSVAIAFRGRSVLTDPQLDAAVEAGIGGTVSAEAADAAIEALGDLGFIWRVDDRMEWEPGIPSLMEYAREALQPG